jgi:hypothetical protein
MQADNMREEMKIEGYFFNLVVAHKLKACQHR